MHPYYVFDEFISPEVAAKYIKLIEEQQKLNNANHCRYEDFQLIVPIADVAQGLWRGVEARIRQHPALQHIVRESEQYELIGMADDITLSRHYTAIKKHHDKDFAYSGLRADNNEEEVLYCLYKVGVYLNTINAQSLPQDGTAYGGTVFYNDEGTEVKGRIEPKPRRGFAFDIRDLHSGDTIPTGQIKYMIGFRLLYRKCDNDTLSSPTDNIVNIETVPNSTVINS